ncbi:MAG: hypothetical protein ACFB50_12565 [Rubrobacteraceae bacterium]
MDASLIYELIGYVASVLVAASLTMRSILKLRVLSLSGGAVFTLYGILITAYPVVIMNAFIVLINLYYLYEMKRAKNYFSILETEGDTAYLNKFLSFYEEDIHRFFPSFDGPTPEKDIVWFILRDMVPAGLMIAEPKGPDTLFIHLDYVIPGYRDLRPGEFLYEEQTERFEKQGIKYLETIPETKEQREYIERMDFMPEAGGEVYRRSVS